MLGWSNERKIDALLDRADGLAGQLAEASRIQAGHEAAVKAAYTRGQVLAGLAQTRDFAEIDYQSAVEPDRRAGAGAREAEGSLGELARLDAELAEVREQIGTADAAARRRTGSSAGVKQSAADAEAERCTARGRSWPSPPAKRPTAHFDAIRGLLAEAGQRTAGQACRMRPGRGERRRRS